MVTAGDDHSISDNTLRELTGYRLQRATSSAMVRYKAVFAEFGLRRTTFSCLSLIVENPGLRQSQLGDMLAIERPNLVQIVDDLKRGGLIVRETSKTDRRAYALTATDTGAALFNKALKAVRALDEMMTAEMTDAEIKQMQSDLARLERNASQAKP